MAVQKWHKNQAALITLTKKRRH